MLFKKRVVRVQPAAPTVVTPVQQPVVERRVTIERSSLSGEAAVMLILAGLTVLALVWYLALYRPRTETRIQTTSTTPAVIERKTTEVRNVPSPPVVVERPVRIVTPPAPENVVVTPPAQRETVIVTPPAPRTEPSEPESDDSASPP